MTFAYIRQPRFKRAGMVSSVTAADIMLIIF